MRLKEIDLAEAATILIGVGDGVLADSLRFSLGLEGFDVRLCDEHSLPRATAEADAPGCLVLDHEVFARMLSGNNERRFAGLGFPVILMVGTRPRNGSPRGAIRRDPCRRDAAAWGGAARHDQVGSSAKPCRSARAAELKRIWLIAPFSRATP